MKNTQFVSLVSALLILIVFVFVFFAFRAAAPDIEHVACTADAMQCPDGSYVGRSGPDCAFAACPDAPTTDDEFVCVFDATNIAVISPYEGEVITSPLLTEGYAVGNWYFEGSAPVVIRDWQGTPIAQSYIVALGDWMTTDKVDFTGRIDFTSPYSQGDDERTKQGSLIFKKANPSGLPENEGEIIIPIRFAH